MAAEGGGSVFMQGTNGDFGVAVTPPPGVYLRNDLFFYDGNVGTRPLGGAVDAGVDMKLWVDTVKLAWVSDYKLLGATYSAAIAQPFVLDTNVSGKGTAGPYEVFREGDKRGLGDLFVVPIRLTWEFGDQHLGAGLGINLPTGKYSEDNIINLGRNYWAFDPTLSYSWISTSRGHEVSFTTGVLFNLENPDTNYRTGTEYHLDWLVGQWFSPHFAAALNGYWYEQISDDHGDVPGFLGGFRGRGVGLGPAALANFKLGGRNVTLIAKWLHDVESKNRFDGDLVMLSAAVPLWP